MEIGFTRWAIYVQWRGATRMVYVGFLTNGHIFGVQYYPNLYTCKSLTLKGYEKVFCSKYGVWSRVHG